MYMYVTYICIYITIGLYFIDVCKELCYFSDDVEIVRQVGSDVSKHSETDMETDNEMEMSQADMMFGGIEKEKEISPRKLKYSEAHSKIDDADMAGPSGVKISKPTVKITKADDSSDFDNEKSSVLNSSKTSQKKNYIDSTSEIKNNSKKSKSIFSQDTINTDSLVNSQSYKDMSPEEILRRLVD